MNIFFFDFENTEAIILVFFYKMFVTRRANWAYAHGRVMNKNVSYLQLPCEFKLLGMKLSNWKFWCLNEIHAALLHLIYSSSPFWSLILLLRP
jgi:hypothetical protein